MERIVLGIFFSLFSVQSDLSIETSRVFISFSFLTIQNPLWKYSYLTKTKQELALQDTYKWYWARQVKIGDIRITRKRVKWN